jgi:hypothetical protein
MARPQCDTPLVFHCCDVALVANRPKKKDLKFIAMGYWKTLKTIENLAEKPDLTLRTCLNVTKLFLGCDQIW